MRLICPNCTAQYDVPDDAIPALGRDLHCAACTHDWFFTPPAPRTAVKMPPPLAAPALAPTADVAAKPASARPTIAPGVAAILRAEAARNASAAPPPPPSSPPSPDADLPPPLPRPTSTGFWRGFATVSTSFALLTALYLAADDLSVAWPQLAPSLTSYSSMVDQMRLGLTLGADTLAARFAS